MEIRSELEVIAWITFGYLFARVAARVFRRWPKTIAAVLSLGSVSAVIVAYNVKQDHYDAVMLVVCGLVAGTLECWVRIWRESTKTKWVRAE